METTGLHDASGPSLRQHKARHQRVDGAARIAFKAADNGKGSALADLYQHAPCRFLFPEVEPGEPAQAVLLTTSGGLTGGDRLSIDIEARERSRVTVTTQAAEKIYRALDGEDDVSIRVEVRVGAQAWAERLAQDTILFDRARLRRVFSADIAVQGRLLAVESIVFGRGAMGERFERGQLHDAWRIRRNGRLIWADAQRLSGDITAAAALPFGYGTAAACATLLYVGDDAESLLPSLRESITAFQHLGGATAFDGLLLVRLLANDASELRAAVLHTAARLRELAGGLEPRLPRVWYC